MALERGLGKGLGAILGDAALQTQAGGSVLLPISQVSPGMKQPRKRFNDASLADLAESIRNHGIIQPLTVRRLASGYYQIIAGERRWRAAKLAELSEVPAMIIEADDREVMELGLIENLLREDLNPMEEALGYQSLIEEFGLSQEETANCVGKSRPAIANALRLISLPDAVHLMLEEGTLSAGHARALLSVSDGMQQKKIAQKVLAEGLSVRQTEQLTRRIAAGLERENDLAPRSPKEVRDLYIVEAEKSLSTRFGRGVKIHAGKKSGKVELQYYSNEDLMELLDALVTIRARAKGGIQR